MRPRYRRRTTINTWLNVVKPMLTAFPHLADSKGPPGNPLIVHAQKSGQEAAEVAAFLEGVKSRPV
jgi:hypothetical protein